jgi:hypothetical protein
MIELVTAASLTKAGVELIKTARELLKKEKPDVVAISEHLNQLQDLLYQAREALADKQEENRQLKAELEKQHQWAAIESDMEFVEDGCFYVRKSDKAAGKQIAYCPLCLKADKKDVPLDSQQGSGSYFCTIHKRTFHTLSAKGTLGGFSGSRSTGNSWM